MILFPYCRLVGASEVHGISAMKPDRLNTEKTSSKGTYLQIALALIVERNWSVLQTSVSLVFRHAADRFHTKIFKLP